MKLIFKSLSVATLVFAVAVTKAQAVNIAILDTGLDPGILGPFIEPGGFDFVNNDNDPSDESSNLHGTAVGDVAVRSGRNITLTAIKTYQEADGTTNAIMADGFNYTASLGNVRVVNYSGASLTNTPL